MNRKTIYSTFYRPHTYKTYKKLLKLELFLTQLAKKTSFLVLKLITAQISCRPSYGNAVKKKLNGSTFEYMPVLVNYEHILLSFK